MPIDLYKLMGYDYRDKKRESQLSVDADVERAKRIAADDWEAKKVRGKELEGIARNRFTENYAKTRLAEGQTEGVGEEAETAWAKKVASGDLKDVLTFEDTAGRLPGTRKLAGTQVGAQQEKAEADMADDKARKLTGLAKVAGLIAPGVGEFIAQAAAKGAEKQAKQAEADVTEQETRGEVAAILKPDAAKIAQEQRELKMASDRLNNLKGTVEYDQMYEDAVNRGPMRELQRRGMELGLTSQELANKQAESMLAPEVQQIRMDAIKAQTAADLARAQGSNRYGNMPGMAGQSIAPQPVRKGPLTADELDFGNSLR